MKDFRESVISGAIWMLSARFSVRVIGFVSSIILARILSPEDFGLVGIAGSVFVFFAVIGQFGFDAALIHFKNPTPAHYNAAWTANILVGLCVSVAMLAVAEPAAEFFNDPRIEYIVYAFALLSLAKGFENIGVVNFRKNLEFRGDFLYFVIPKLASLLIAIPAALLLESYWALVIGMIGMEATSLVYSHFSQPFRPRFSIKKIRELFTFSRWIVLSSIIGYLAYNGVEVLLGKLSGPEAVGLLGIAVQIAALTSSELLEPINRSLFPSFASISEDLARFSRAFTKIFSVTLLLSLPTALGVAAISDDLVNVVFGSKWAAAAPILAVLAFVGVFRAIRGAFEPAMLARGRPSVITLAKVLNVVTIYPAILYLFPKIGLVAVAYALLLGQFFAAIYVFLTGVRELGISIGKIVREGLRPTFAAISMFALLLRLEDHLLLFQSPSVLGLSAKILTGAMFYLGTVAVLWQLMRRPDGPESYLIDAFNHRFRSQ